MSFHPDPDNGQIAAAMLAHCRHLFSGREIALCEDVMAGEHINPNWSPDVIDADKEPDEDDDGAMPLGWFSAGDRLRFEQMKIEYGRHLP